jgi:hypothetical protein
MGSAFVWINNGIDWDRHEARSDREWGRGDGEATNFGGSGSPESDNGITNSPVHLRGNPGEGSSMKTSNLEPFSFDRTTAAAGKLRSGGPRDFHNRGG